MLALSEYMLYYIPQKLVKGQVFAYFLADHPCLLIDIEMVISAPIGYTNLKPWIIIFDGSKTKEAASAWILLISPTGIQTQFLFQLAFPYLNNQVEYEALIIDLEILLQLNVTTIKVIGDS